MISSWEAGACCLRSASSLPAPAEKSRWLRDVGRLRRLGELAPGIHPISAVCTDAEALQRALDTAVRMAEAGDDSHHLSRVRCARYNQSADRATQPEHRRATRYRHHYGSGLPLFRYYSAAYAGR